MSVISEFQAKALAKLPKLPELKPGYTVKVYLKIQEGQKERIQVFEGLIINRKGKKQESSTITVRKIATGGVGVERIFPLISPSIQKIEVIKRAKIRRAHLGYLRELTGKAARLKEIFVSQTEMQAELSPESVTQEMTAEITKQVEVFAETTESAKQVEKAKAGEAKQAKKA